MSDQPFFGREAEQNRFRALLKGINNRSKPDEGLPTVVMLYGQGGIGKTALAKRFRQIADDEFKGRVQTFFLGWEEELEWDPLQEEIALAIMGEVIAAHRSRI